VLGVRLFLGEQAEINNMPKWELVYGSNESEEMGRALSSTLF